MSPISLNQSFEEAKTSIETGPSGDKTSYSFPSNYNPQEELKRQAELSRRGNILDSIFEVAQDQSGQTGLPQGISEIAQLNDGTILMRFVPSELRSTERGQGENLERYLGAEYSKINEPVTFIYSRSDGNRLQVFVLNNRHETINGLSVSYDNGVTQSNLITGEVLDRFSRITIQFPSVDIVQDRNSSSIAERAVNQAQVEHPTDIRGNLDELDVMVTELLDSIRRTEVTPVIRDSETLIDGSPF
jgi:hypothetical protein